MQVSLRVLLVEDEEHDAQLLLRELARLGYEVTSKRVMTGDAMREALGSNEWDLIISDFRLPGFDALGALTVCRELQLELPLIIVSGTIDEEEAVESMRLGAQDFVTKGKLTRLGPAITRGLRRYEERKALRAAETRLRQAQKMEAIGQLAGGVAHDFNNLLAVILGHAELLLKDLPPGHRGRTRVEEILSAADRAASLTRQLLTFSRQQPVQVRVVDLNAAVANIDAMVRRLIKENVRIVTTLGEGLRPVRADPVQIEQVLVNLAINARDAMEEGGRLTIETSNVDLDDLFAQSHPDVAPGPYVLLAVSDTGYGMDASTVSRIFEPFFTTKPLGQGTGLGLATVYGIVRQSGGYIAVTSEVGHGTTVNVYFPAAAGATADAPVMPNPALPRRGTETILLVEDEEAVRVMTSEVLREEGGYTVIEGPTPEAALAAAEKHDGPIHLLITDMVMPGLSGRQAADRVQALRLGVKVLYMSGYTGVHVEGQLLEAGQRFLQKPFSVNQLLRKVREVLEMPAEGDGNDPTT